MRVPMLLRHSRRSPARAGAVLVYHRVAERPGDEDREILAAVSLSAFERQLDDLRRHYRVVLASEILKAVERRQPAEPFPVAITFDDDLAEHVRYALPALRSAGLTATFFLTGSALVSPHGFWWEDLQRAIDARLVSELPYVDLRPALAHRSRAILDLTGAIVRLTPEQRLEIAAHLRAAVGPPPRESGLTADDIRKLTDAGCAIGFHTHSHEVLTSLRDDELERELHEGRGVLEAAAGAPTTTIAYPHGKADGRVASAARKAGFAVGFTTARGLAKVDTDPLLLPRTVADLSASALSLRLAQLFATA
jgi:peptidoglycan/xylan/chitin deacetylase (PgdA/CDA1 family)